MEAVSANPGWPPGGSVQISAKSARSSYTRGWSAWSAPVACGLPHGPWVAASWHTVPCTKPWTQTLHTGWPPSISIGLTLCCR